MRRHLIAACAAAPLALVAGAAFAQTTISTSQTTPVATSSKGDIDITASGAITGSSATPLVTVDSSNKVTLEGALVTNNVDNAVGVLLKGGNTGSLTSTGSITLGEDYSASDSANSDGVIEAPFAQGVGKAGVLVSGPGVFTGDLNLGGSGVAVKGNNSFGISITSGLTGAIAITGPLSVVGDHSTGLSVTAPVSGLISVSGTGTGAGTGAGARVIDLEAPAGSLRIYGAITNTGYSLTTRTTTVQSLVKIQQTPLDLQQSGAAVTIGDNLASGFFLGAPPLNTASGTLADVDGDGLADGVETQGTITNFGSAPAVIIGSAGKAVNLGVVGTGAAAYGAIIRGGVLGSGVYDGVAATGMQFGAGGTVNVAGGVLVTGTISASTYEADATAVHILGGTTIPVWRNDGIITSTVADSSASVGLGSASARGFVIDAGATFPTLVNTTNGVISTSTVGNSGQTAAVIDRSGTLSTVINQGTISALRPTTDATSAVTGSAVALDLSANTSGVTLLQRPDPDVTVTYGSTSGTADVATTTEAVSTPHIIGDVLLGSGPNSVDLESGTFTGTLDLGSNTASLILNGGSAYYGRLRYTGSALTLAVNSGTLTQLEATTLKVASLNLGSTGTLNLAVDPHANASSLLQVSGAATIADGAKIGLQLLSAVPSAETFTLITSPNLTVASSDANLLATNSFLVAAALHTNTAAGTLTVTLTPKSAAELGLNASEGSALAPVVDGAGRDSAVSAALLGATDAPSFTKLYRQLLPEHSNGVFHAVDQATRAIADLSTAHNDFFRPGSHEGGVWMEEFLLGSREDRDVGEASETGGFGLAGGVTTADSRLGATGLTFAYVNASTSDPDLPGTGSTEFSQIETGLNWRTGWHGLEVSARGGGGYIWGVTRRQYVADATSLTSAVTRSTKGTWNAWTLDARLMVAYRADMGRFFIQPQAALDFLKLEQDGYTERFGGDGLNLAVDDRSSYAASVTGSVQFGGKFGQTGAIRPVFEVGVRDVFAGDGGLVSAAYAAGGSSFALNSTPITGAGGLAKFGLKYAGSFADLEVAAKAEAFDKYQEGNLRVAVSTRF